MEVLPYKVVNKAGKPAVQVVVKGKTQTFSPEEIVSKLFARAKMLAEDYLNET